MEVIRGIINTAITLITTSFAEEFIRVCHARE